MESVAAPPEAGDVIVLATSGGPHSAEDWAGVTMLKLMTLIELSETTPLKLRNHVERFELNVRGLARDMHAAMARRERTGLENHGAAYLAVPIDPTDLTNQALAAVMGFAGMSVLRDHFARRDVQTVVYQTFGQHLADNANVERRWFCDTHPDDTAAQAYLTAGAAVHLEWPSQLHEPVPTISAAQLLALNPFMN